MAQPKHPWRKILPRKLALFLPGIFLLGFNIGTGSVTAMAKAGADFGMALLWTIVASCLCTFFMINQYGRYTLVTGVKPRCKRFRKHIHPGVGAVFYCGVDCGCLRQRDGCDGYSRRNLLRVVEVFCCWWYCTDLFCSVLRRAWFTLYFGMEKPNLLNAVWL